MGARSKLAMFTRLRCRRCRCNGCAPMKIEEISKGTMVSVENAPGNIGVLTGHCSKMGQMGSAIVFVRGDPEDLACRQGRSGQRPFPLDFVDDAIRLEVNFQIVFHVDALQFRRNMSSFRHLVGTVPKFLQFRQHIFSTLLGIVFKNAGIDFKDIVIQSWSSDSVLRSPHAGFEGGLNNRKYVDMLCRPSRAPSFQYNLPKQRHFSLFEMELQTRQIIENENLQTMYKKLKWSGICTCS
jgi:hypothetical protein